MNSRPSIIVCSLMLLVMIVPVARAWPHLILTPNLNYVCYGHTENYALCADGPHGGTITLVNWIFSNCTGSGNRTGATVAFDQHGGGAGPVVYAMVYENDGHLHPCVASDGVIVMKLIRINGVSGSARKGTNIHLTAVSEGLGSLPPGYSIEWSGDAEFSNKQDYEADAKLTTCGLGLTITAKISGCDSSVDSQEFDVVDIISVTASKEGTCVGGDVTFTANTCPGGIGDRITWSAEGGNPESGTGDSFSTWWGGASMEATAIASIPGVVSASKSVRVACPVNFDEVDTWDDGHNLYFAYAWESSSGVESDLEGLKVGEWVDFPGSNNTWPNITCYIGLYLYEEPMYGWSYNPVVRTNIAAEDCYYEDMHESPEFTKPYSEVYVTAYQRYWYRNPDRTGGTGQSSTYPWTPTTTEVVYGSLLGPLALNKFVAKQSGVWKYSCTKSNGYVLYTLP